MVKMIDVQFTVEIAKEGYQFFPDVSPRLYHLHIIKLVKLLLRTRGLDFNKENPVRCV